MSVAGFILALVGFFIVPIVFGPLSVILSGLGLKSRKKKGLAIAGLVIGVIDTVYAIMTLMQNAPNL